MEPLGIHIKPLPDINVGMNEINYTEFKHLLQLLQKYKNLFATDLDSVSHINFATHIIDTGESSLSVKVLVEFHQLKG